MTLGEYRDKVFSKITQCERRSDVTKLLQEVEQVLRNSEMPVSSKRQFWVDLYQKLSEPILIKEQSGSALSDIIAAAKEVISQNIRAGA